MMPKFVDKSNLATVLEQMLAGRTIFVVRATNGDAHLERGLTPAFEPCGNRSVEPLKSLLFGSRRNVATYFEAAKLSPPGLRAIVGASACDLAGLRVLDYVFLEGDHVDTDYQEARRDTLLVACDCTEPREVCFCTYLGGEPHPTDGYDLNLSAADEGFIIESGSQAGQALLEATGGLSEPDAEQVARRDARRRAVTKRVHEQCANAGLAAADELQGIVGAARDGDLWQQLAEECVECGACNFICPTCHCFLLLDLQERHGFRRFRNWDSCQYPAFAREASGANPRPSRAERLYGRVQKKLEFIPANAGLWGCVGCGRCAEACAGRIDVRETLAELANA